MTTGSLEALADGSAAEIGRALAAGRADPVDLTELLLARIGADASPTFITVTAARARAEAAASSERLRAGRPFSPLDGVPIAWKDLVDMAGEATTVASALHRDDAPAAADAPVVANAARAGMVSLGKLNLAEFAYSALGQNPHFGTPHNPNAEAPHAPGGSSSGSGVAVAAGLAPCALGSDTGGSVRIPASFCGVVGFKTSVGRVPTAGGFVLSRSQDTFGPLARSAEDCALLDGVLRGAPQDVVSPAALGGLTLFAPEGFVMEDLDDAVGAAFEASLSRLSAAGARIRRGPLPALDEAAVMLGELGTILAADAFVEHRAVMDGPEADRLDPRVRARIEIGRRMSAADLTELLRQRAKGRAEIAAVLNGGLDGALLAMPTTPGAAPAMADFDDGTDSEAFRRCNLRAVRNTSLGSFYDLPGLAIPNGRDGRGLPTSFLLCALQGDDDRVLRAGLSAEAPIRQDT